MKKPSQKTWLTDANALNLPKTHGLKVGRIYRNAPPACLYEKALQTEKQTVLADNGALMVSSHEKTGRSPQDKGVVKEPLTQADIWWGNVNKPIDESTYQKNFLHASAYLNTLKELYVVDGYAGWDPRTRLKVRVICTRAYHALFMYNMLIRPSKKELSRFHNPDCTLINAGCTQALTPSKTAIYLSFAKKEMIILGTEYAGEMKKGVFTLMNYVMPKAGVLSMHCSANVVSNYHDCPQEVSLFFGLSGTGKTTLSADINRSLIGDDEHCWTSRGISNIEGGCYAKVIDLSQDKEPQIYEAIRYGTVLENVDYDAEHRHPLYESSRYTENTRASYPIEYIPGAKIPCVASHPTNVIFLTCDAFGIFPPVSKLSPEQAAYYFISGYTAKVAGTEMGVTEPEATFSACFGAAFLVWSPSKYTTLLHEKMLKHRTHAWLINTGWTGGGYHHSKRIPLKITRSILDAIHNKKLLKSSFMTDEIFGFKVPTECPDVPKEILIPKHAWPDADTYHLEAQKLARLFHANFKHYEDTLALSIRQAGPKWTS